MYHNKDKYNFKTIKLLFYYSNNIFMLCTHMTLKTWSGLVDLSTVWACVTEAEVRLHMSSHVLFILVLLSTMVALPAGSFYFTDHLRHRVKDKGIKI